MSLNLQKEQTNYNARAVTPLLLQRYFKSADSGNIKDLMLLAESILARDWDIMPYLEIRCNALSLREWEVMTADLEQVDEEADSMLRNIKPDREDGLFDLDHVIQESGKSCYYGLTVFEVESSKDRSHIFGFRYHSPAIFGVDTADNCLTVVEEGKDDEVKLPSDQFYMCVPKIKPHKHNLARLCAILHMLSDIPAFEWSAYVEAFATPLVHAEMDVSAPEEIKDELAALKQLLEEYGGKKFIITSKDTSIGYQETNGTGNTIYNQILDYFRKRIATVILGSSDGLEASGRRVSEVLRHDLSEGDEDDVEKAINATIVKSWSEATRGADVPPPVFRFKKRVNVKAFIDDVVKITSTGKYEVAPEVIQKYTGIPVTAVEQVDETV